MKRFFFLIVVLISVSLLFADVPEWLKKPEKEYPTSKFIRTVGEGANLKLAQDSAVSAISLYFDTKTEVLSTAVKEMSAILSDGKEVFNASRSIQQIMQITSNAEFFCVKFTDAYYDKKSDKFSVLAYINKKDASQIYTARIAALMDSVNVYREYAKKEKEPFLAVQALRKAEVLGKLAESYIHNENIIVPADTSKFQNDLKIISLLPAQRNALKNEITFSISINQKEKRYDPLFSTVASILEKYGYAYSVANPAYNIILDISCIEETYDAGEFVRPSVDILILNKEGNGVYTYSKSFPRIGSKSTEQAYTRAVTKIKQDLEENFLAE